MSSQLTRNDFEALLWDYLTKTVKPSLLPNLGITTEQWDRFTDDEIDGWLAAVDAVKAETARRVILRTTKKGES